MNNLANFKKTLKIILVGSFIATNAVAAQAKPIMHQLVQDVAENYVFQNADFDDFSEIEISTRALDERVQIPACPVDLEASSSAQSLRQSNITVKVSCPSNGWFHYLNVKLTELQEVVVVDDTLSPGTILTKNNTKVIKMDRKRLRGGTFADKELIVGARLKRRTRDGMPVTSRMLCFVCKGDAILITAKLSGLEIKTSGVAQQDGNIGDTISVKNKRSKKVIEAKVANVNEVTVQI
jgi:flagella basal body P-ring formation protein FlgA